MALKLHIDVNVILDVATERYPHWGASQSVLSQIEQKKAAGFVSAVSYPILYYIMKREIGDEDARAFLAIMMELLSAVRVDRAVLERAIKMNVDDYEDAIQIACAEACRADFIVTRDIRGYKKSPIKALTPSEYLATYFSG